MVIGVARRDASLDTLLALDGQVLVIDEAGYWVKFVVHQLPVTVDKPHGLDYTLTMPSNLNLAHAAKKVRDAAAVRSRVATTTDRCVFQPIVDGISG